MPRLGRFAGTLLRCAFVMVLLTAVFALLALLKVDLAPAADRLASATPALAFWRLALVGALIALWGPLMRTLARQRGLTDEARIEAAAATRWPLAIGLLAMELVLVQHVFGPFTRFLP